MALEQVQTVSKGSAAAVVKKGVRPLSLGSQKLGP
jgi:hypothetical protein